MNIRSIFTSRFCLSLIITAISWSYAQGASPPNLVFILADDLGWSGTTLYGHTDFYETPNIQRLAKRGMLFSNAYSAQSTCSPTRASIMTGQDTSRTGVIHAACHLEEIIVNRPPLAAEADPQYKVRTPETVTRLDTKYVTLAETIREAGYVTGHFGKWHLGNVPYSPLEHGFDVSMPHNWSYGGPGGSYVAPWTRFDSDGIDLKPKHPQEHIEDRMADEACAFIEANRDKPFFLNYWAFSVHAPLDGKKELIKKYTAKADPNDPSQLPLYGAMVESLDDAVGQLLDTLDRLELSNNTIVVFFSDNGGASYLRYKGKFVVTSNAPLRAGKATIYEGGTRVPCAVVWPGKVKPDSHSDALLSSTDWYPTLLEMMGIPKPDGAIFDGVSQVPAFLGKAAPRESFVCNEPWYGSNLNIPCCFIRRGPWKLIRFFGDGPNGADRFELYNLDSDIGETKNVADANMERVKVLDAEISTELKRIDAIVPQPNPSYQPGTETIPYAPDEPKVRKKSESGKKIEKTKGKGSKDSPYKGKGSKVKKGKKGK